jgi:hypothetical protein
MIRHYAETADLSRVHPDGSRRLSSQISRLQKSILTEPENWDYTGINGMGALSYLIGALLLEDFLLFYES